MRLGGWVVMLTSMILFLTFTGVTTSLTEPLTTMGIFVDEDTSQLQSGDLENSSFWAKFFGSSGVIFALVAGGISVAIGLFGKGFDPSLVYAPIIVYIGGIFISSFWKIILFVNGFEVVWLTTVISMVLLALGVGFIMACVDYFGGR